MKSKPTPKAKPAPKPKELTIHIAGGFVSRTFFRALQDKDSTISEFQALGYLVALFEAGEITAVMPDDMTRPTIYKMAKAVTIVL